MLFGLILSTTARAQVQLETEAFSGSPFGVGRVTLRSGGEFRFNRPPRPGRGRIADLARRLAAQAGAGNPVDLHSSELSIQERKGRLFYPVFSKRDRPILQQFISVPSESTVYFLFTGDAPLELAVLAADATSGTVVPRNDPAGHARLLGAWWQEYSSVVGGGAAPVGYPAMVEQYLVDTLSRRLGLSVPAPADKKQLNLLRGELSLLAGTEAARLEMADRILLSDQTVSATLPLPEELPAPQAELLTPPVEVPVEPLANRVPAECFYVRFGNFPNFLWLRHRTEDWGGELRDVVSERGLDYGLNAKMQKIMGLREGKLAEVFGDKVIADVALIGTDMFMNEGAAIGTLFQAKSSLALSNDLTQQRRASMRETPGATEEKLEIAGHAVSKIASPDGAIRSFYVADGDFHLVTTSQQIVEWFLATADGRHPSLASSNAFRATRARLPLTRNDTVFVYLSPEFFENLLSAHYHIEMQRRLRSDVELALVPIAQLAAKAEGRPAATVDELITSEMLPAGFGQRADGSHLEQRDGKLVDSLRGARGTFLPVPDMKIERVTTAEAAEYQEFKQYYVNEWGRMEPVALSIRREDLPEGKLERVIVDALAAPLAPKHVEMLSNWLGEPTTRVLTGIPGDVVSFQAVLQGGGLLGGPAGEYMLFGALRNADPAIALSQNTSLLGRILQMQLQGVQGYVGAWPHPGMLSLLSGPLNTDSDPAGFARLPTGLWRRQLGDFTLLSFHPEILDGISPALQFDEADRPAQVRIHAEDLANSTLAPLINAYGYKQSRAITAGNARFMNMLIEQLHVPPAEAMTTGEQILGATFMSPLGEEYKLEAAAGGPQTWVATALVDKPAGAPPADYQFRALNWLRGMQMELLLEKTPAPELSFHGEFIMPVEARAPAFELPKLPFSLPKAASPEPAPAKPQSKASAPKLPPPPAVAPRKSQPREL
jgi:hypothetical protein